MTYIPWYAVVIVDHLGQPVYKEEEITADDEEITMKLFALGLAFLTVAILARENHLWLTWVCIGGLGTVMWESFQEWWNRLQKERNG